MALVPGASKHGIGEVVGLLQDMLSRRQRMKRRPIPTCGIVKLVGRTIKPTLVGEIGIVRPVRFLCWRGRGVLAPQVELLVPLLGVLKHPPDREYLLLHLGGIVFFFFYER